MDLKPITAASYAWNINSAKGLFAGVRKTINAIGAFFTAIYQGYTVSKAEQDNYLSIEWRKNTIAGKEIQKRQISDRLVMLNDVENQLDRTDADSGLKNTAFTHLQSDSETHIRHPSISIREEAAPSEGVPPEDSAEVEDSKPSDPSIPVEIQQVVKKTAADEVETIIKGNVSNAEWLSQEPENASEKQIQPPGILNTESESLCFEAESASDTDFVKPQPEHDVEAEPAFITGPSQNNLIKTPLSEILPSLMAPTAKPEVLNTSSANVLAQVRHRDFDYDRSIIGGKGMFLQHMKNNGIPVPDFRFLSIPDIHLLEKAHFSKNVLPEALRHIELPDTQATVSLDQLKQHIFNIINPEEQTRLLAALSDFLASDHFYNAIKDHATAAIMRDNFKALCPEGSQQKVIIRSSGAKEDGYGDAQAGKYESYVHGGDDVVLTCLKVMASGYRPEVCKNGMPTTLSLVMQHCVDCQFGGVTMSYTGLKDNRMQVEYVPGQPKGAVSGLAGLTPHRYTLTRNHGHAGLEHTPGDVSEVFYLESKGENEATEELTKLATSEAQMLPEATVQALYEIIIKLENLLQCPVDVEFGVNGQNEVQILQVRPMTRLQGGAQFSVGVPSQSIAKGTLVSEGLCKGRVVSVKVGDSPENLPDNAIIVAHHGEDWMLAPDVLSKASGFVFEQGGTGDHVAITLRQAGKPCIIADEKPAVIGGVIATLACGEFNGQSGGFLLEGEQAYEHYQTNTLPAATSDFSTVIARAEQWQPTHCDETRVDHQFKWLNSQNTRLLQYFERDGLINRCLSPEGAVLVSMSPQRHQVLSSLQDEISHFLADTDALLQGYDNYLNEGVKGENTSPKIKAFLENLEILKTRVGEIKVKVNAGLDRITEGLLGDNELLQNPADFSQWQADCQDLKNSLQELSQPRTANQVRSVHDTIFLVHKSFVDILADVANASGQGVVNKASDSVTFVNFNTPGMTKLLDDQCASVLKGYGHSNTVLNMDGVSIISTDINYHKGVIELIDKGAGSQGRLMRVRMIDNFKNTHTHFEGKFKRYLWLALLLNRIGQQNSSQGVKIELNEEMGEIVVEINNIPDVERMRQQLIAVVNVMNESTNMDNVFCRVTNGLASVHDFPALRASINRIQDADSRTMCKAIIFNEVLLWGESEFINALKVFFPEDSDEVQLINFAQKVGSLDRDKTYIVDSEESFQRDAEQIRFLLIEKPKKVLDSVRKYSDWLESKEEALPLVTLSGKLLKHLSPELKKDRDIVMAAATHAPAALKHGDEAFWSDREILSAAAHGNSLEFSVRCEKLSRNAMLELFNLPVSSNFYKPFNLKKYPEDADVMLAGVKHKVGYLHSAAESLTDDMEFMKKAIQIDAWAYTYASDRIKGDQTIASMVLQLSDRKIQELYNDHMPEALRQNNEIKALYVEGLQRVVKRLDIECASLNESDYGRFSFDNPFKRRGEIQAALNELLPLQS